MAFRDMRRSKQALSESEIYDIVERNTSAVLSLIGDDGYPYGVPLSYVELDGKIYFHSATTGHKLDAIRSCDKACLTIIDADDVKPEEFTTYYRSVIMFGRVSIIDDLQHKIDTLHALGKRYNPDGESRPRQDEIDKGLSHVEMIEFAPEHVSGKQAIELMAGKRED